MKKLVWKEPSIRKLTKVSFCNFLIYISYSKPNSQRVNQFGTAHSLAYLAIMKVNFIISWLTYFNTLS